MGVSNEAAALVKSVFAKAELPVVVDADALNILAESGTPLNLHAGPRIFTPHPGELRRLLVATDRIRADHSPDLAELERLASALAGDCGVVMVVKSHQTFVTDGQRNWRCDAPANSGLATGGTGDVLAGIMAGFCAQKIEPAVAAVTAVAIHAQAARHAVEETGPASMVATDLIKHISFAMKTFGGTGPSSKVSP
jgi:NAD(P)H-hydrate epimerase